MSNSVRPPRQQPTRLPCPWDSPGKNTGVGCHFLLQCMKVKSEREVAQYRQEYWSGVPSPSPVTPSAAAAAKSLQSCPTLCDPIDGSPPGFPVPGILQASAAAAAKSLQPCPTLCDPMDCSLPGFSVHGILQARTLEWVDRKSVV